MKSIQGTIKIPMKKSDFSSDLTCFLTIIGKVQPRLGELNPNGAIVAGVAHYCAEIQYLKTYVCSIVWQRASDASTLSLFRFR